MQPLAEKKSLFLKLSFANEISTWISDRRRIEQILINLINNAIKFTDRGGVTVTVALLNTPQPAVRITVKDTGIGVKPEHLSLLFQPFRQLDSGLSRQHEGTGLGLAICRRLVTLLGGEIAVVSDWSKGSEFAVVIPTRLESDL
jgi:signal transduction histidine kinase